MAISDISLTTGMRNNLISLQKTASQINTTQTRLSSGKKVNSALDNPTSFFAAQSEQQRASDLSDRKDAMSEAVQTIKAADAGITAITSLIQAAKGLATNAVASNDSAVRATYQGQYTTIKAQIDTIAQDSGYRGTNLLQSQDLKIEFGQYTNDSVLTVNGSQKDSTGLALGAADWGASTANATTDLGTMEGALTSLRNTSSDLSSNLTVITTRQEFTSNMINTLQTGADNLTLADMNEESANMLMLNTRQSLGTTALSLSSQAAQSILRLF